MIIVIVTFQQGAHSVTLIFSGALQHTHNKKTHNIYVICIYIYTVYTENITT